MQETSYEHWHRMLFARFLTENGLLMHADGVPLTLDECNELARDEGAADGWELAGRYASRMLPQIFRPDSPVLALKLAPEHQRALENLLAGIRTPDCLLHSASPDSYRRAWRTSVVAALGLVNRIVSNGAPPAQALSDPADTPDSSVPPSLPPVVLRSNQHKADVARRLNEWQDWVAAVSRQ